MFPLRPRNGFSTSPIVMFALLRSSSDPEMNTCLMNIGANAETPKARTSRSRRNPTRKRIVFLSVVIFLLAGISSQQASASVTSTTWCDERGACGACCVPGQDCINWCNQNCGWDHCPLFTNTLCCASGEMGIECGHAG